MGHGMRRGGDRLNQIDQPSYAVYLTQAEMNALERAALYVQKDNNRMREASCYDGDALRSGMVVLQWRHEGRG